MPVEVEIVLRVPQVKEPLKNADGYPVSNHDIRFVRRITTERLPKNGDVVPLTTVGHAFEGKVNRVEWHDDSNMFKVYCQYGQRTIPPVQFQALTQDPDWAIKPLL
jgi:hypothetical protein